MKKKITFLLLMIFASANIYSQNYTISFAASGAATTLDSVRIINLTHPDTAMWHDGDIFQLQLNNAINDIEANKENLYIFPNPMQGKAEIMFNVKQAGIAIIKIYEITGKEIIHLDENLSQGNHQFQLTGLKQGAFFINIRGNGYFYSSKLISYNSFSNDINLKYNGVIQETLTNKYKTSNSSINFNFVSGDILQYTGYAANLTAVVTNSPTSDITITFNFIASLPSVTTNAATSITFNSALSGGNVTSDGGEIVTERGICYATTANPTFANNIVSGGSGTGLFTANLTGLIPSTTYYVRTYATNSIGTAYGNEVIFTTIPASLPILTTTNISSITSNTAISGGNITSDGGASVTARGVCWSTVPNPHIGLNTKTINGIGIGSFTSNINGLTLGTTYYVRAYATNSLGTAYGNELSFTTLILPIGTVIDYDGNVYDTVHIGTQVWLKQNLKTTHYKNGAAITYPGTNNTAWQNNTTGAYAWYNNDEATYKNTYGALYNWYALNTGNLCPTGWHVPSDADWTTLTTYLGGEQVAGGKLKEAGLSHWDIPNTDATNSSGFTALPGGYRLNNGLYEFIGKKCYWWSSSVVSTTEARFCMVYYADSKTSNYYTLKASGFSVRCLMDFQASLPTITTTTTSSITATTAISGGNITNNGGSPITARGVCWSTSVNPTVVLTTKTSDGTGIGFFASNITGLTTGTTYYVRAYATNNLGTAYGNEISFTYAVAPITTVIDYDGNGYDTIHIGTQVWMKQNLKTTHYKNGIAIPNITNNTTWSSLTSGAYSNYNNDTTYAYIFGRLYNWYAVNTGNLCPTGWHVPSDDEWTTLTTYLGGENIAGGKLKEVGLAHWNSPNTGATNSSGFTALPGGIRNDDGTYLPIGDYGRWWSSTEYSTTNAWRKAMRYDLISAIRGSNYKLDGFSVRCIKD